MIGNKLDLASQRGLHKIILGNTNFLQKFLLKKLHILPAKTALQYVTIFIYSYYQYLETSAKTGQNVEDAFLSTAKKIYELVQNGVIDPNAPDSGVRFNIFLILMCKVQIPGDAIGDKPKPGTGDGGKPAGAGNTCCK